MTDMSNVEFIRDLAARMFRNATPAMGFDQGDTDRLYVIANRLAALEQAGEPVAGIGGVTDADREAYLAMNILPEFDAADVRAGLWDKVTGVQAFAAHRLQSVAAATAAKDAEVARLRKALGKISDGRTIRFTGSEHHNRPLRDKDAQVIARAALSEAREAGAKD